MINGLKSKLPEKGGFVFNVLVLMTGTTIAQAIPIAISSILTRIYSPENFGVFALFISITSILSVVITGRYELAIMLPEKDEDSINVVVLSILIAFSLSFFILLIVSIFNTQITRLLGNQEISKWLYFVPLTVLLIGIYQSLSYWSIRKKQFKRLSVSKISKSAARGFANIPLGFLNFGSTGLITGSLVGQTVATSVLSWQFWKNDRNTRKNISKEKMLYNAKRYKNFPKYSMGAAFANMLSYNIINILISSFYNINTLGFYSLVNRVLVMPSSLIGSSISQVFFQRASEERNRYGNTRLVFNATLRKLIIISLPFFAILYFIVKPLFAFVFGEEWRIAGRYAQILIPLFSIRFIASSLSIINSVFEKQKISLSWQIGLLVLSILTIFICNYLGFNFDVFLKYFTAVLSMYYLLLLFIVAHVSKGVK